MWMQVNMCKCVSMWTMNMCKHVNMWMQVQMCKHVNMWMQVNMCKEVNMWMQVNMCPSVNTCVCCVHECVNVSVGVHTCVCYVHVGVHTCVCYCYVHVGVHTCICYVHERVLGCHVTLFLFVSCNGGGGADTTDWIVSADATQCMWGCESSAKPWRRYTIQYLKETIFRKMLT